MKLPIYLDYAATTPVDPLVAEKMCACLTMDGNFANPASRSHLYGWQAEEAAELARRQVADLVGADPREIVWTSGATESDNLAIKGAARAFAERGRHIITSQIEHKAVIDSCRQLEREGFEVTYLKPDSDGLIGVEQLQAALREDTILVSLMHVNNEIGVVNDIAALGALVRERGILFHVDAAQSTGKLPINLKQLPVDLMSFSAHKSYGPKGIGALYVRRSPDVRIEALIHGGGHERGMRSGTLAPHQLVGMGEAFALAGAQMKAENERISALRDQLLEGLASLDGVSLNGSAQQRVPHNLNLAFTGVDGELLLLALRDLALSTGSACTSASVEPSYVLRAIGLADELAHSSIRLSLGRFTTEAEVQHAAEVLCKAVSRLRQSR
ncbi:IscS subfamily cysteine desulfurase [Halopseudomonas bauzanensis]|uniref:Cysteine desulfurase IscS n=1 Tax=Halopseudomonas bauzanensis TaxID=653930 RepID=A0A1H9PAA6_9GAMM|nr:IscS subfamily cysteine desulfurase [Halopseudomonas bauzanensis]SER45067.1 cysteine desulfurase IscS [Halopseudomonas bauzanensis]SFL74930.1 cysteine desulfurase IscS [Halopseudomonas bauzanensis]